MQPAIVKYRETEKINHMIATAIAGFVERHIEIGDKVYCKSMNPNYSTGKRYDYLVSLWL